MMKRYISVNLAREFCLICSSVMSSVTMGTVKPQLPSSSAFESTEATPVRLYSNKRAMSR